MQNQTYRHQRGQIQESALKALVSDPLFRCKVEKSKKGKGSYRRKEKHAKAWQKGESPFKNDLIKSFLNGLF